MIFNFKSQMFEGTKKSAEFLVKVPKIFSVNIKANWENSHTNVNAKTQCKNVISRSLDFIPL